MASTKVDWGQYAEEQDKLTSKVTQDSRGKCITHLFFWYVHNLYYVHTEKLGKFIPRESYFIKS